MASPRSLFPRLLTSGVLVFSAGAAVAAESATTLALGVSYERAMGAGEAQTFELELPQAGAYRAVAVQRGLDVELSLERSVGEPPIAVDSPFDRQGSEVLAWEAAAAGRVRLTVRSREPAAPSGRFEIRCDPLPAGTPAERQRLAADLALTRAGARYREGTPEARRAAGEDYARAAAAWSALGARREEVAARYAAMVVSRLVGEPAAALAASEPVLALWQGEGEPVWEAAAWNEVGLDRWLGGDGEGARAVFERALALDRAAGEAYGEAVALANLCLLRLPKGELREGVACYREALPLLRAVQATALAAAALTNVGRAQDVLGEPGEARAAYAEALLRQREVGDRLGEARTLNNLGVLEAAAGEVESALARYARARDLFVELGDRRWQARVLNNLGLVYHGTGDLAQARASYEAALPLWRAAGDGAGEAATLNNLGRVRVREGFHGEALDLHRRALALWTGAGDRRGEGLSLAEIGRVQLAARTLPEALEALGKAAGIFADVGDRANESYALWLEGEALTAAGRPQEALPVAERSLERARASGSMTDEAAGLSTLAEAERALGRTPQAIEHALQALDRIEMRRVRIGDPSLRISYSGFEHLAYERALDLLLAAHHDQPAAGFDRQALAVSERSRARTLLELLAAAHAEPRPGGAGTASLERLRALEGRLSAKAERLSRLGEGAEREALRRESQEILREIDLAEAEVRQGDPEAGALALPQPLTAPEIQGLLDPGTVLLSYALGSARSALWMVTSGGVETFDLPPRSELEAAARRLHEGWSRYDPEGRAAESELAAGLGRTLLGPVAARLAGRRVAVVADGALEYVPFGALPLPPAPGAEGAGGAAAPLPLLAEHEVVLLPSASVLARERQLRAGRAPAPRRLAVLADPVFDPHDPRVAALDPAGSNPPRPSAASAPRTAVRSAPPVGGGASPLPFDRLPASRREAQAIAALLPPGEALVALDFDAARDRVLGGGLAGYQVIHFATHGVLDAEHPALSGLALSTVDREGRPREGFLHLRDIYGLRLAADLVVLSGCRTALGREVRGEGLSGLARGFLSAGAPRVVASLWPVEDRATAALMTAFYRALWQEGKAPAAALRAAQLAVRGERRWRDPYFWAGFVLEGAWD